MPQPFRLTPWEKPQIAETTKKRLAMPMKASKRETEWLYEAPISSPELSLGVAILQRAVLDLVTPGVSEKDKADAFMWLNGDYGVEFEESYSMSFSRVVQSFSNIDVEEFRSKILAFVSNANQECKDIFRFQRS